MSCWTYQTRSFLFPSSKLKEVLDTVLRVDNKSGEVRSQPTQVFLFAGYEFHLDLALVNPLREMTQFSGFDPTLKVKHLFNFRMFDVVNWVACLNGENGPGGTPSLEAPFQFHLKEHWRYPRPLHSLLPWTESFSSHLEWWQVPQM